MEDAVNKLLFFEGEWTHNLEYAFWSRFAFFLIVYFGSYLLAKRYVAGGDDERLANLVTSTVHSIMSSAGAASALSRHLMPYYEKFEAQAVLYGSTNNVELDRLLVLTASYMVFDFIRMLLNRKKEPLTFAMLLHHVLVVSAFFNGIRVSYGTLVMVAFQLNELTTPSLNLRVFLKSFKVQNRLVTGLNELLFASLFAVCRVALNTFILAKMFWNYNVFVDDLQSAKASVVFHLNVLYLLASLHAILNYYWFALILRLVYYKLLRASPKLKQK